MHKKLVSIPFDFNGMQITKLLDAVTDLKYADLKLQEVQNQNARYREKGNGNTDGRGSGEVPGVTVLYTSSVFRFSVSRATCCHNQSL
jgi:hypothetical protein